MKPNIQSIHEFTPNFTHKFFFDSNVWLYLLFPQYSSVSQKVIRSYSELFSAVLTRGCLVETTILQISELVNLIQRIEFKLYCDKIKSDIKFKDFIKSANGEIGLRNAQLLVDSILKSAEIRQGNLTSEEMKSIMKQIGNADFNDICIAKHCEKEKSVLVTHDFDFRALSITIQIVSANENYVN